MRPKPITLMIFSISKGSAKIDVDVSVKALESYIQYNELKLQPIFDRIKACMPEKYNKLSVNVIFTLCDLEKGKPYCITTFKYPNRLKKYLRNTIDIVRDNLNDVLTNIFLVAVNANDAMNIEEADNG